MNINRRHFLAAGLAVASGGAQSGCGGGREASAGSLDFSGLRSDFPLAEDRVYLNHASQHPVSRQSADIMKQYADYLANDLTRAGWTDAPEQAEAFSRAYLGDVRSQFAKLINAKPSEISFTLSTTVGENIVVNGMGIESSGGNVVTNDLHYSSCLYNYKMRQKEGLDVRIVKHRDWRIDLRDMEEAVDKNTKLVAITLVSNVNGYLHDVKAISGLAHAHGAYVYADIIQAAGAVPIDVRAMGIDFASCSTYKWLMGLRGFAYLYIREDLQGAAVKPTQFGGGVRFNYPPWAAAPDPGREEIVFTPKTKSAQYEVGNVSNIGAVCQWRALDYIQRVGVENIRKHAKSLTDRLQRELPAMGYPSITPQGNESPIVTFLLQDPEGAQEKLKRAGIEVTLRFGNQMRVAVSVMNNQQDIDRLLEALAT